MQIFVNLVTRQLQRSLSDSRNLNQLDFKRGDVETVEIFFVRAGVQEQLTASSTVAFAVKVKGEYDGTALVFEDGFTLSGSGSSAKYVATPSFNTVPLDDALSVDDDETNDLPFLDTMGEITWTNGATTDYTSTETFNVRINNDVIRGDEATPSNLPDPEAWQPLIEDGDLTIAKTSGLQTFLDGKAVETHIGPILPRTKRRLAAEAAAGSVRPFRLKQLALGDSYIVDLSTLMDTQVAPLREIGFGTTVTLAGGATQVLSQWTRTPNGGTLWLLNGSGQSVEFGDGTLARECYRVKVFYQTENITGTFAVETNTNNAGWVEVPGATTASPINADNDGTTGCGIFSYDFSTSESRKIRAKWVSGTVRILGFVLSDIREDNGVTRGGCAIYTLGQGGVNVGDSNACPQAIWDTILQNIEPDFVTLKGDDTWTTTLTDDSTGVYKLVNTARKMDWVFIGRHPSNATAYAGQGPPDNSGNEMLSMDVTLRNFAIAKGHLFINPRKIHPDITTMIDSGLTTDGNAHLTTAGQVFENQAIFQILQSAIVEGWKTHKTTGSLGTLPRYNNNALGVLGGPGQSILFDLLGRTNSGGNFRPAFAISKLSDNGDIGFHQGQFNNCEFILDQYGSLFGNYTGFALGLPTLPRAASGMVELYSGDRTTNKLLVLSGKTGHTGDLFTIYEAATTSSAGTRRAGITAAGNAEFARLKATIPSYADDAAADADTGLLSGQLYKTTAGGRAVYQKP